jgi:hypothetical protein
MASGKKTARKKGVARKGGKPGGSAMGNKCPNDARKVCKAFNKWANEMYLWADEVTKKLWPPGNPGPTNPPPKPPFDM